MTHFVTSKGRTLYKRPVNFIQQSREEWDIQLPTTERVIEVIEDKPSRPLVIFAPSER